MMEVYFTKFFCLRFRLSIEIIIHVNCYLDDKVYHPIRRWVGGISHLDEKSYLIPRRLKFTYENRETDCQLKDFRFYFTTHRKRIPVVAFSSIRSSNVLIEKFSEVKKSILSIWVRIKWWKFFSASFLFYFPFSGQTLLNLISFAASSCSLSPDEAEAFGTDFICDKVRFSDWCSTVSTDIS